MKTETIVRSVTQEISLIIKPEDKENNDTIKEISSNYSRDAFVYVFYDSKKKIYSLDITLKKVK